METLSLSPFSHAECDPGARSELVALLLARHAQHHTAGFLSRRAESIGVASSGLLATLERWSIGPATPAQALGFPLALSPFHNKLHEPVWVAAMAALHLHAAGYEGEWRATFARPASLRFAGMVTPPVRSVAIAAAEGNASLELLAADGETLTLRVRPCDPGEYPEDWIPLRSLDPGTAGRTWIVLDKSAYGILPTRSPLGYSRQRGAATVRTLERAAALLENHAASHLAWVTDLTWAILPVAKPDATPGSSTSTSSPGLIGIPHISFPLDPMQVAELLVHETSHQYYHCAQIYAEPCNDEDKALYWSPYASKERPIDRILIAFHAFANVVLLYRAMLAGGMARDRDRAERAIATNLPMLTNLSEALSRSPGLTDVGRSLFEPLRSRLFSDS